MDSKVEARSGMWKTIHTHTQIRRKNDSCRRKAGINEHKDEQEHKRLVNSIEYSRYSRCTIVVASSWLIPITSAVRNARCLPRARIAHSWLKNRNQKKTTVPFTSRDNMVVDCDFDCPSWERVSSGPDLLKWTRMGFYATTSFRSINHVWVRVPYQGIRAYWKKRITLIASSNIEGENCVKKHTERFRWETLLYCEISDHLRNSSDWEIESVMEWDWDLSKSPRTRGEAVSWGFYEMIFRKSKKVSQMNWRIVHSVIW